MSETPDVAKLLNGYKGKEAAAQKENFENSITNIQKNTEYGKLVMAAGTHCCKNQLKGIR